MKLKYYTLYLILMVFLASFPVAAGPFVKIQTIDVQKEYPNIRIDVLVKNLDKANIPGLDESHLLVYEDGYRVNYVKVNNVSKANDFLYLVFSLDSSWSISQNFMLSIKNSAKDIIESSGPRDNIAIYRFNDKVILLNNFTSNKRVLLKNINSIMRHGKNTLLHDSVYDSINLLNEEKGSRKGIIVFTDGKDEGSSVTVEDIVKLAQLKEIPVYFISFKNSKNIKTLARIAKLTGGKLVYSNHTDQVSGMYKTILACIKSKYVIKYKSMLKPDGKKHQVEIRLTYGEIKDRDIKDVSYERKILELDFFENSNIILVSLVFILLILLFILLIYFIYREKNKLKQVCQPDKEMPKINSFYDFPQKNMLPVEEEPKDLEPVKPPAETLYASAWLIEKHGTQIKEKHPVYLNEFTIGADSSNNIILPDDCAVAPKHAKISHSNNSFYIFDLISDTGTFLNGKKLLRPKVLYDWDEIQIGKTIFIFRGAK